MSITNQLYKVLCLMAYYKRIKELREDNDKTQNEIAKYLGMKQPQYCRYEN